MCGVASPPRAAKSKWRCDVRQNEYFNEKNDFPTSKLFTVIKSNNIKFSK
jgi:hypothetical protein